MCSRTYSWSLCIRCRVVVAVSEDVAVVVDAFENVIDVFEDSVIAEQAAGCPCESPSPGAPTPRASTRGNGIG